MDHENVMVLHQRLMQDVEFIRSRKELNVESIHRITASSALGASQLRAVRDLADEALKRERLSTAYQRFLAMVDEIVKEENSDS